MFQFAPHIEIHPGRNNKIIGRGIFCLQFHEFVQRITLQTLNIIGKMAGTGMNRKADMYGLVKLAVQQIIKKKLQQNIDAA
jgi:hypothetical protein